ncbi:MAG: hypothetical protein A3B99_01270 [Candidatus Yanofskybacteria bacterium RIFCSPHIGHO2_02_FULL_44_12b]|uniref:3D domain-containing protein n=1 Tax=Candidatus Yanofskybacteria bacterium RIFCSPLOWO2_01_FULL_44_22 TaxID=1802697 RepID=A0A1F8GJD5_9BACT|nr:MAG: hypothetical protein A2659_03935 [Candidatus Yanofskybacteria bacterium RIFCSPHIGHO2_01_FULL_44_24]OGN15459.1 MAG: hypothetical protein A3B99_01270 [Candidatus Yanofskybacteria bacterium RIFCSPHIGHO2_02_FULL_44_12b]OGN25443.1 MAG: hypothetical protein A2925_00240 [Candidatus Yanofskybacteria bacterium RIFCSPLOWO2_01_FULL_44_22]
MVKITQLISIGAVVLLCQLIPQAPAQAGFFSWASNPNDGGGLLNGLLDLGEFSMNGIYNSDQLLVLGDIVADKKEPAPELKVVKTHTVRATGYSSTPDQTDSTPFITASGAYVRDGIIAANFYVNGRRVPFGTLVRIPEIYGDKVFVVEDRMNARYTNNIDIWFPERNLAKTFGSKRVVIEIVQES